MARRLHCLRCGHDWTPFLERRKPKQCPKCRARMWDKPRMRPKRKSMKK